jgi:hypothetical protein
VITRHVLLFCAALGAPLARGQDLPPPLPAYEVTPYFGRGADTNLPELPGSLLKGDLHLDDTWFAGAGFAWPQLPPAWFAGALRWIGLERETTAFEIVGVQHWGLQRNFELGALYLLRTPFGHLGSLRARVGAGFGFSYAFARPSYEDGPEDDPDRRYRFQNFDAFELETGLARWPGMSLVGRVHHRSGMYGLIAPSNVGSNFMTLGLRLAF